MICVDSSSVIAYLDGSPGADIELVDQAFRDQVAVLSPESRHRTPERSGAAGGGPNDNTRTAHSAVA
jgi:hypothetical protein